jgi:hypothetical protein
VQNASPGVVLEQGGGALQEDVDPPGHDLGPVVLALVELAAVAGTAGQVA